MDSCISHVRSRRTVGARSFNWLRKKRSTGVKTCQGTDLSVP